MSPEREFLRQFEPGSVAFALLALDDREPEASVPDHGNE